MSNDNLILFPKESKPTRSMTNRFRAKWVILGSLLLILVTAVGVNAALFSLKSQSTDSAVAQSQTSGRSVASINPIFKDSWEKKAFQVLENTSERELASIGETPSSLDQVEYGDLEGKYQIRKVDGKISEIRFNQTSDLKPTTFLKRDEFLNNNLALFSQSATKVQKIHVEDNSEVLIEKFELLNGEGQGLGTIQVLLDKNQNLLSMTIQ